MLQNVKLQNVMLQMNLDVNLIEYPEFSAIACLSLAVIISFCHP